MQWHPEPKVQCDFDINTITILLQGVININVNIFQIVEDYSKYGQVIISTYDDYDTLIVCDEILSKYPKTIIINNNLNNLSAQNDLFGINYDPIKSHNYYFQLKTTLAGLEKATTPYVLKSRVDHHYADINKLIMHGIGSKKMVVSSNFVRGFSHRKYHFSDCLFFGETSEIIRMYNLSYKYYIPNKNTLPCLPPFACPEVSIWRPYLLDLAAKEYFDIELADIESYIQFICTKISIYCINLHKSYRVKYTSGIYTKGAYEPIKTGPNGKKIPHFGEIKEVNKSDKEYLIWGTDFGRGDWPSVVYP
jgi:hypothetical protein